MAHLWASAAVKRAVKLGGRSNPNVADSTSCLGHEVINCNINSFFGVRRFATSPPQKDFIFHLIELEGIAGSVHMAALRSQRDHCCWTTATPRVHAEELRRKQINSKRAPLRVILFAHHGKSCEPGSVQVAAPRSRGDSWYCTIALGRGRCPVQDLPARIFAEGVRRKH
jgi:hypothetical protein